MLAVTVVGKGNAVRSIHYDFAALAEEWDEWAQKREVLGAGSRDYLFLTTAGKPVSSSHVNRLVERALKNAEIRRQSLKKGPHMLRHSFATYMIYKGHDISVVKKLLGHASITTTQRYLHHGEGMTRRARLKVDDLPRG